jgi:hypothetical protein
LAEYAGWKVTEAGEDGHLLADAQLRSCLHCEAPEQAATVQERCISVSMLIVLCLITKQQISCY